MGGVGSTGPWFWPRVAGKVSQGELRKDSRVWEIRCFSGY